MLPAVAGAVVLIVNVAVPFGAPAANGADNVTVQVKVWPAAVHVTVLTPVLAVALMNVTPAGNTSFTVITVPLAVWPLLPRPIWYASAPLVSTVAGPVFVSVMFAGVFTVVGALPQLVAGVQPGPGVGGFVPPVGSVEA